MTVQDERRVGAMLQDERRVGAMVQDERRRRGGNGTI